MDGVDDRRGAGPAGPVIPPTARLEFLPLRVDHAEEMADVLADPRLHEFIGGEPDSAEGLRARYGRMTAGSPRPDEVWLNWVIRLREANRLVGTVQATVVDGVAEIAWVVGTPWQGRGIAREAARRLAESLGAGRMAEPVGGSAAEPVRNPSKVPVDVLVAHIHPDHHASAAVARAAGLAPTGQWHEGEVRWERRLHP